MTATQSTEHHDPNLAHHFETPQQQFDSGKLGIWLFLTTEILLFSGLFCAYAVYRANHPEVFYFAHEYLDKILGAINTVVLIFSSFTMAWAVRAAQLGQQKLLVRLLIITLLCGLAFMGIKSKEYYDKYQHGTLWGPLYNPHALPGQHHEVAAGAEHAEHAAEPAKESATAAAHAAEAKPATPAAAAPQIPQDARGFMAEQSTLAAAPDGPSGINPAWENTQPQHHNGWQGPEPANVQTFFGIYFVMTGLHGLHVLAGMFVIFFYCLLPARKGRFGPGYFNPVDFCGLYWHLVDLVWIFLFPLLYLIH